MWNSKISGIGLALICAFLASPAFAKRDKEKFWDGHCQVERKWKKDGRYEQKRKCRPMPYAEPEPNSTVVITLPTVLILPPAN
jgi:hypothetical protein